MFRVRAACVGVVDRRAVGLSGVVHDGAAILVGVRSCQRVASVGHGHYREDGYPWLVVEGGDLWVRA